ncbi:MAG: aminopeptidase P family protein [Thaumarchaeota archaeon]|nr:aminopeptidase P family protein [Nitrososphaerota archaeon]
MLLNRPRAKTVLREKGLDAAVATTTENVTYLTDFRSIGHTFFGRSTFAILPADDSIEPALIVARGDTAAISIHPSWVRDVRFYGKYDISLPADGAELTPPEAIARDYIEKSWGHSEPDAISALVRCLEDRGLADKNVGIDEGGFTPVSFELFRKKVPRLKSSFASGTFKQIRMIKTPEEISKLRRAAQIAERGMEAAAAEARPGVAENELAKIIYTAIIKNGGTAYFVNVHCGTKGSLCVREFTDYRIREGDVVYLDVGAKYRWYCGDTGVTAVAGRPTDKVRKYQKAIVRGERDAIEEAKPGVKASDLYKKAIDGVRKNGIPHFNYHRAGHGIGLENSDLPAISAEDPTPLEKDMVLCVETPYLELGLGGFQAEDTFLVKERGIEWFTSGNRELREA